MRSFARLGVRNTDVLRAMRATPRQEFVPLESRVLAYADRALSIGFGATISQPYIVGLMTELLGVGRESRVLEIGTGSGYQAAVLSQLAQHVYTVELQRDLARAAAARLTRLGYGNVSVREGNGAQGWPEEAPFDRVIVTAAAPEIPPALLEQLQPGGRLVAPVGEGDQDQELVVIEKSGTGELSKRSVIPVRFIPLR
jgi:protein-L-isoaspartate(D-aspartate) O-methyltransferase